MTGDDVTVDVDIGRAFTDCFVPRGEEVFMGKAETTENDLSESVLASIDAAVEAAECSRRKVLAEASPVRYSTPLGLNTMIAHEGTPLGLRTDESEELTSIGRGAQWADGSFVQARRNVGRAQKPEPRVAQELTASDRERVNQDGDGVIREMPAGNDHA